MTAVVVFCCFIIASVTSNGDDFNVVVSSYSPRVLQDVQHVPDLPFISEDGYFLNEILQPPTSDQLTSVFPMPYEVQALLERSTSFSIRILNCMSRMFPKMSYLTCLATHASNCFMVSFT